MFDCYYYLRHRQSILFLIYTYENIKFKINKCEIKIYDVKSREIFTPRSLQYLNFFETILIYYELSKQKKIDYYALTCRYDCRPI